MRPPSIPLLGTQSGEAYASLVAQLSAAVAKTGFHEVVVGISGGIDSALVATLAVQAFGAQHVHGAIMPAPVTSETSVSDAGEVAQRLGIETVTLAIDLILAACEETLEPAFGNRELDVTEENLQARIRGTLLMALSNKLGYLVLNTSNKSEILLGYGTLHGDMVGSFAPLAPLYKEHVYELAHYANKQAELSGRAAPIPYSILDKEPSAELAVGQLDRNELGSYAEVDPLLFFLNERGLNAEELIQVGFSSNDVTRVLQRVKQMSFKLRFEPPGAELSPQLFSC